MTEWLQRTIPFADDYQDVQEILFACTTAEAKTGNLNPKVALLTRNEDYHLTHLLLSPAAAKYAYLLPGEWAPVDPSGFGWAISYSAGASAPELGLRYPAPGE